MLFRIGGNIENLVIRNVHYHGSLSHDLLQAGGSYTGEGPASPGMPSRIEHLFLENVYVHGDTNAHDYVKLRSRVENLYIRGVALTDCDPGSLFVKVLYPGAEPGNMTVESFRSDGARFSDSLSPEKRE